MAEISNRTLAFLLVGAIVISLGGTLVSLNKLGQMGALSLTGAATTGNISLTVAVDTSYNVTNTIIDFGVGYITGGNPWAVLDSDYDSNVNWNQSTSPQFLTIQNDGNVNINVSFNSTANATGFLGGTTPHFNYTVIDNELNSCTVALQSGENSITNSTGNNVCESLHFGNAGNSFNDTVNISVRLRVPVDANQTVTLVTWNFVASQALS